MTIFRPRFTVNRFVVNKHYTSRFTTTVSHTQIEIVDGKFNYRQDSISDERQTLYQTTKYHVKFL